MANKLVQRKASLCISDLAAKSLAWKFSVKMSLMQLKHFKHNLVMLSTCTNHILLKFTGLILLILFVSSLHNTLVAEYESKMPCI